MKAEPLAYRMAPKSLEEYVGQQHILAPGKLLRRMIESDHLRSVLFFGPPGTGKSSLARVIAQKTKLPFYKVNAATAGISDLKRVLEDAENPFFAPEGRVLLFLDEIHRFNKLQQDVLLPAVEQGNVVLIGATTENPFFEVNKALLSRMTVFQLQPLTEEEILILLYRAIHDSRGVGGLSIHVEEQALKFWANRANGDARRALNALELAVDSTEPQADGLIAIDLSIAEDCIQKRSIAFDAKGDAHYNTISALIKSIRGSDPDAALFYLALALEGGEELEFLARRLVISAAEDVGLANPTALLLAQATQASVERIGMPEARILFAELCVFLATSPKSNCSYLALDSALDCIRKEGNGSLPLHLLNASISEMSEVLNYGQNYQYAHNNPEHFVLEKYLPEKYLGKRFYLPSEQGYEGQKIRKKLARERLERDQAFGTKFPEEAQFDQEIQNQ